MAQRSTLEYIADLVIRQVLAQLDAATPLAEALERAYPFGDLVSGRQIWTDALLRNAIDARAITQPSRPAPLGADATGLREACGPQSVR